MNNIQLPCDSVSFNNVNSNFTNSTRDSGSNVFVPISSLQTAIPVPKYFNLSIAGISVRFPFSNPYKPQLDMMENAINAYKTRKNAILESPTGTGKSLALLASSLAYQQFDRSVEQIVYSSRTHSQLQQMIDEFKKLAYFPQMGILASRKHLCINAKANSSSDIDVECKKLVNKKECSVNRDVKIIPSCFSTSGEKAKFGIEDLKNYGNENNVCPYQLAKTISSKSNILFCPYNYIISPSTSSSISSSDNILIIDEGHNIEDASRDEASFSIYYYLALITGNDSILLEKYIPQFSNTCQLIRNITFGFLNFIITKRKKYDSLKEKPKYINNENICELFKKWEFNPNTIQLMGATLKNFATALSNQETNNDDISFDHLISFSKVVSSAFCILAPECFDDFRIVYIPGDKLENDQISFLCLRPGLIFKPLANSFRSVVISSGTLSPLGPLKSELETTFDFSCSEPHVVNENQILAMTIKKVNNIEISSKYSILQQKEKDIFDSLGELFCKMLPYVPGGALLFLPSYTLMKKLIARWKKTGKYNDIYNIKIIVEEKNDKTAKKIIRDFDKIEGGGFLIGVCRGKISEGTDFLDDRARIVFAFGIPFPGIKEADVELKMNYNNIKHSINKNIFSGNEWYTSQGFRALFQSIGRCIRHRRDYGAIVLLDSRIDQNINKFPLWIRKNIHTDVSVDEACKMLSSFYTKMNQKFPEYLPPPKPNSNYQNDIEIIEPNNNYTNFNTNSNYISNNFNTNSNYTSNNSNTESNYISNNSNKEPNDTSMNHNTNLRLSTSSSNLNEHRSNDDSSFNEIDFIDDNDNNDLSTTSLFCAHCHNLLIKIINISNVNFIRTDSKLFVKDNLLLSIYKNNIIQDFTQLLFAEWNKDESFGFRRSRCKCGSFIGINITTSGPGSFFDSNSCYYILNKLSMKCGEQFYSLLDIANSV